MYTTVAEKTETGLAELQRIVGRDFVRVDPHTLAWRARTTLPAATTAAAVVRPANTGEVQRVMTWALRHEMPVYPISGGKNWGYGDACAPRDGCLLIDLSRMNRIVEVNAELAYAVIEPGVTQGQLFRYLEENKLPLWMDATGAGPDASVLGNLLERGVGLSPYSDRFAHCCELEVVLPDGQLLHTGFGAYPGARAANLVKHGFGPALDGLFTQANLGIVTRLTFWLMPKPEAFTAFFLQVERRETIGPLMEILRRLRLAGTLRCSVHCFNDMRLLGGMMRYPWDRADGRQALEIEHPELTRLLLAQHQIPAWVATGSLTGSAAEVAAARHALRQALRPLHRVKVRFLDRRKLALAQWLRDRLGKWGMLTSWRRRLDKIGVWMEFLQGRPSYQTLRGAHWRARGEAGADQDPLDSGGGLIWVCPVLPATADAVAEVSQVGEMHFHRFGFEYQVTLSQVSERALCAVMSIHFDRSNSAEAARAAACHDALVAELLKRGYLPYRGTPRTAELLHTAAPEFWEAATKLKHALDPHELLAPGRYLPHR